MSIKSPEMLLEHLGHSLRKAAEYNQNDSVAPAAILWMDPESSWANIVGPLQALLPELLVLGDYDPEQRQGPGIWLRCVIAGKDERVTLENGAVPIIYMPGTGRQSFRNLEQCPNPLLPLAELQFRGTVWNHPNGDDWNPNSWLQSDRGGMDLDVAQDSATKESLLRSLPRLMELQVHEMGDKRIDTTFINSLFTPDPSRDLLRWMNDPDDFRKPKSKEEWKSFCSLCKREYHLEPEKDGELKAGELLGEQSGKWRNVWERFEETPTRYPNMVDLLRRAKPVGDTLFFNETSWPDFAETVEAGLSEMLLALENLPPSEAAEKIKASTKEAGRARNSIWSKLDLTPLSNAMAHLSKLSEMASQPLNAGNLNDYAKIYTEEGWKVDAAALRALACITRQESRPAIFTAIRALYLPWLEASANNLMSLVQVEPDSAKPETNSIPKDTLRIFCDGLRFDVAQKLVQRLESTGLDLDLDWKWSALPTVTATAKPAAASLGDSIEAKESDENFMPAQKSDGKPLSFDRLNKALEEKGVQVLKEPSPPNGNRGWNEMGQLDKRGHDEGWKLSQRIDEEVNGIIEAVQAWISAGWHKIEIVTDHGWILMPQGLPKVTVAKFLTRNRWGRCAWVQPGNKVDLPCLPWHWNNQVSIAYPPGIGCFVAGKEYAHGGISPQEMIVPRITINATSGETGMDAKIEGIKWIGLRCKVEIAGAVAGLKADLRERPADASTSLLESGEAKAIGEDGAASLFVSEPEKEGQAVVLVLLRGDGSVMLSQPTIIGT